MRVFNIVSLIILSLSCRETSQPPATRSAVESAIDPIASIVEHGELRIEVDNFGVIRASLQRFESVEIYRFPISTALAKTGNERSMSSLADARLVGIAAPQIADYLCDQAVTEGRLNARAIINEWISMGTLVLRSPDTAGFVVSIPIPATRLEKLRSVAESAGERDRELGL